MDKQRHLDNEIERVNCRLQETQKHIDVRSTEVHTKQVSLDDTERELARVRDQVSKTQAECGAGRRDNERVQAENFDLRKEVEFQESRNADCSMQIRDTEMRLKDKEENLYQTRRDVENQRLVNQQNRNANADFLSEKEALEKHASCLQAQNSELTGELDRFCQTDEVLRQQLDRRSRVFGLQQKNVDEVRHSHYRIEEARSRSPRKHGY